MYKIFFNRAQNQYELREMVRMFLPENAYELLEEDPWECGGLDNGAGEILIRIPDSAVEKNEGKRFLYKALSEATGKNPDWGILTGVRPVKLFGELEERLSSSQAAAETLEKDYLVSPSKVGLLSTTRNVQRPLVRRTERTAVGLYVGIPFCPTRCVYCSFPSNQAKEKQICRYLETLAEEISFAGRRMADCGMYPESIYIGGGTPTALNEEQLETLLTQIRQAFDLSKLREYTVEAGRPDTITEEKLSAILRHGAERISINPQSMKKETLERIGRRHTPEQIEEAFAAAKKAGIPIINMDLIAGLPEETPADFKNSLERIIRLAPENITVHTLAVKRASRLHEMDETYCYCQGQNVRIMLEEGRELLDCAGYRPYYLYRQKQMTGNFENVGYAKPGTESLYNVKIMEENQTIVALGAGGISKMYYPAENRLERVPNVSNYEIYIERIGEMLQRKENGIFSVYEAMEK